MKKIAHIALALTACLAIIGCGGDGGSNPPPRGGSSGGSRPAPATSGARSSALFRLPMVNGQEVTVRGPVALFFFTSWCGYCKQVMPEVKRLAEAGRSRGWRVYGVQVAEGPMQTNSFVQQYQPNFPVLMDQQSVVAKQYGIKGYPTFILIDENANIVYNGHEPPRNLR